MLQHDAAPEDAVDVRARDDLARVLGAAAAPAGERSFRSWTPAGMRVTKRRRFTWLAVDGEPLLVAKSAMDTDDLKVAREWEILRELSLPGSVRFASAVARTETGFVMEYSPSLDLPDALQADPDGFRPILERVVDTIASMNMHGAVLDGSAELHARIARLYVAEPDTDTTYLQDALEGVVLGPTHGDLSPWNIRYSPASDNLMIIDWEDYRPIGITGIDILNLVLTLGIVVFPEHRTKGMDWLYDQLLESDHWYALLLRELVARYATAVGRPARQVMDLLPFFCQWLPARLRNEGRDPSAMYYGTFRARYLQRVPGWVKELPSE